MLSNSNNSLMTTQVNDYLREVPQKQRQFIGVVYDRFEDNLDNDQEERCYKIKFNILGLPEFQDEWPIAIPLGNSTRPVEKGNYVLIYDLADSMAAHTFFYVPVWQEQADKRFTGIKNYDNELNLTEKNYVKFVLPNCTIEFDKTNSESDRNKQDDITTPQGNVKIESGGSTITIDGATGNITVKGKGGSVLTLDGYIQNTTGFTAIPTCPYSGAPHCINTVLFQ